MEIYYRLNFKERIKIETYNNLGWTFMKIADQLGRTKSTISREITCYPCCYSAEKTQYHADLKSRNHNFVKRLDVNDQLFNFVNRYLKIRLSPQQISTYLKKKYAESY